jgi:hypothetical protein
VDISRILFTFYHPLHFLSPKQLHPLHSFRRWFQLPASSQMGRC